MMTLLPKYSIGQFVLITSLLLGSLGDPIFFYGRGGQEINRKRSFHHPFGPRSPPPPPNRPHPNRVPCLPNYIHKTKYITKTTSLYKTIYETEFFPKTVFDTSFKTFGFDFDPSTVTTTSTSTIVSTRVEPVYITTTEFESTSITSTVTQLIYDTKHLINSLQHTRFTPEIITKTIIQDVFHTDIETVFSSRTVTVTRTETAINTDCPGLPSSSDSQFLSNTFDSRARLNRELLKASLFTAPVAPDLYEDIKLSNSRPKTTYTGLLPPSNNDVFSSSYRDAANYFNPLDPLQQQVSSLYGSSNVGSQSNPFIHPDNKLFNSFGTSHLNAQPLQNYLVHADYSSRYQNVVKPPPVLPEKDKPFYDHPDDYTQFTQKDIKFTPSRPDPTSISDIIGHPSDSEETQEDHSYGVRQQKLLSQGDSLYGIKSTYRPTGQKPSYTPEDTHYIGENPDTGEDIHIREILKGVKGGEIHEEIHNHGLVEPRFIPHSPELTHFRTQNSKYSNSYHEGPPVYVVRNQEVRNSHDYDSGMRAQSYLKSLPNEDSKHIHPLIPQEIEYSGLVKSSSESATGNPKAVEFSGFAKSSTESAIVNPKEVEYSGLARSSSASANGQIYLNPSSSKSDSSYQHRIMIHQPATRTSRTLFRSEMTRPKVVDVDQQDRSLPGSYGAHSMPIVINLNGSQILDMFKNTSANTFTPSKLLSREIDTSEGIFSPREINSNEHHQSLFELNNVSDKRKRQLETDLRFDGTEMNDWVPLVPSETHGGPNAVNKFYAGNVSHKIEKG